MRSTSTPRASARLPIVLALLLIGCGALLNACSDADDSARAQRLARLSDTLAGAQARAMAYGHELDVLRSVRTRLEAEGTQTALVTPDGALYVLALRAYHQWNSTAAGRDRSRATDFDSPDHPIHEIVARAKRLREQGIDYLYVLVPSRLELYPELLLPELAGLPGFSGMNPGTLAFQAELAERGVESVPLLGVFAANRYAQDGSTWLSLRTQPLWTPAGVALCAREIASAVRALPWFEQGPATEGVDFQVDVRTINPKTPLPPELQGQPGFDEPEVLLIEAVRTREELAAHVPDRESPIVVLGDTAVGIYERLGGDLPGQLYRLLGHRLDVASSPGGDYWQNFERRPDALAGKRLVIEVQSSGFRLPPTPHADLPGE